MKILIIGSAHPIRGGGISTFNERLALELQKQHDVVIYSFSLQYPSILFPGKNQFTDEPAPKGLHIKSVINSINPINWLITGQKIQREKPDLIIVRYWIPFMGPCFGTILRLAKRHRKTKVIAIVDNVIPHEKRPGDQILTKFFLKPVDGFISMSRNVLTDLKKFEPEKSVVYTPHPVYDNYGDAIGKHDAQKHLGLSPGRRYILFFGIIRKYKGLDILLRAMADERLIKAGIRLIVAGEYYGERTFYEQLIDELGIQSQLHLFTDFIPNEEVKYYFSAADCVVQPYRSATQSGISQIAYHFEKPMIVTNVGGLPEIVPDGKVGYVTEVSAEAIADAILKFYSQGDEARFSASLKEEKQKYSWDHFTHKIDNIYQLVANDSPA